MSNGNWPAIDVIAPVSPDRQGIVVQLGDRSPLAPQKEHRAGNLSLAAVFLVVLVVQRRGRPVLLADRMHGVGVAEFPHVLRTYFGREGVLHLWPRVEHEVDQDGGCRSDEPLG